MLPRRRTSGTRFLPKSEDYAIFNCQLQTWRNDGPRCATLSAASTERGRSMCDRVRLKFPSESGSYTRVFLMPFLVPHITHRRTKGIYRLLLQQTVDEGASQQSDVTRRIDFPSTSSIAANNSNDPVDSIDPGKNFLPNLVNT